MIVSWALPQVPTIGEAHALKTKEAISQIGDGLGSDFEYDREASDLYASIFFLQLTF